MHVGVGCQAATKQAATDLPSTEPNYKGLLNEAVSKKWRRPIQELVHYTSLQVDGGSHNPRFQSTVTLLMMPPGTARSFAGARPEGSIKGAEKAAAKAALEALYDSLLV